VTGSYRSVVRPLALSLGCALLLTSCGVFGPSASDHERTVLVDYHYDQFANMFARYFPSHVTVRQGDTAVFKQAWNGEAHTVSFGQIIDTVGKPAWNYIDKDQQVPQDVQNQLNQSAFNEIPFMVDQNNHVQQNGAQPCYLDSGTPPTDINTPCPKRAQPAFTGRQAFYSSGFIPYQGTDRDNTFRVPIAADAKPGTYHFICLFHGPGMNGALTIVPKGGSIPSQSTVDQQAQSQIDQFAKPLVTAFSDAKKGRYPVKLNTPYKFVLAGYGSPQENDVHGYGNISEFYPKTTDIKVGDTLRWLVVADFHNVAFDVPRYFPEFSVAKDGRVTWNPQAIGPVASPGLPASQEGGPSPTPTEVTPQITNGGSYDGSHFISSGLGGGGPADIGYALTFTKAGTYHYACLIHPQMVGTVIVH
jgi:plastocyanin